MSLCYTHHSSHFISSYLIHLLLIHHQHVRIICDVPQEERCVPVRHWNWGECEGPLFMLYLSY